MDPHPRGQIPEKRSWCRGLLRQGCWWGDECLYFHVDDWVDGQTGQKMLLYKDKKQLVNIFTTGLRNAGRQGDAVLATLQRSLPKSGYQKRVTWESLEELICLVCETLHRDTEGANSTIRNICKCLLVELRPFIESSSKHDKKEAAKHPGGGEIAARKADKLADDDSDDGEGSINTPQDMEYFKMLMTKMSSAMDNSPAESDNFRLPLWMRKESGESTASSTNNNENYLSPAEESYDSRKRQETT